MYTKNDIKIMLATNPKAVVRGVLAIYNNQLPEEQYNGRTIALNGVGFNGADSRPMSRYAEIIRRDGKLAGGQFLDAKRRIMKYAGQLVTIANSRKPD